MRGKSHQNFGRFLSDQFLADASPLARRAFLIGCIEPDRNPATYLKGSLRHQWLRGHNYDNALPFVLRISARLESRRDWSLWDYYTAGKLVHYTMDAFTFPHNREFPEELPLHREYEHRLQLMFLEYLHSASRWDFGGDCAIGEYLQQTHRQYLALAGEPETDCRFAFHAGCQVLARLTAASRCTA